MSLTGTPTRILHRLVPMLLFLGFAAQGTAQATIPAERAELPPLAELDEGWNALHPEGETTCAHGDDFHFWARAADPSRLMVYLDGGGGCWDAETCDPEGEAFIFVSTVEPDRHPELLSGIIDSDHPENPVSGYSMVVVPVCTGDAFLGDRDARYTLETESGETRHFTIHHRGQTNTRVVMDWIQANFEEPREILVAGSSAGAVGTPFYASLLAQHYPAARVVGLGDDGGSWGTATTGGADPGQWGTPEVLQRQPGWEGFHDALRVEHLYITAALSAPNLKLYQFDHAHDARQRYYIELTGAENPDVLGHIRANRRTIRAQVPEFRSFTAGGFAHTVLREDLFYHYQTEGHRLRDWIGAIVADEPVASVECTDDCLRPGLVYSEQDLRIVDRAIEILSAPGAWNPADAMGPCPPQADRYSLRCASVRAAREITGETPAGVRGVPPALWDIIHTAGGRMGDRRMNNPGQRYNNHPDSTAADMIALLGEVADRIRESLAMSR
jgi:hypothetical protein